MQAPLPAQAHARTLFRSNYAPAHPFLLSALFQRHSQRFLPFLLVAASSVTWQQANSGKNAGCGVWRSSPKNQRNRRNFGKIFLSCRRKQDQCGERKWRRSCVPWLIDIHHLGSVKAVVNGNNGNLYEVNNYTVIWQTEREQQRQQLPEHSSHRREVPPALHRQGRPGPGLLRPVHGLRCATVQPGPPPLAGPRPPEREVLWHKPLCLLCGRSGEFGG